MAAHHCPTCGAFSWHGPGAHHWALTCPACGETAPQHPHAPDSPPERPDDSTVDVATDADPVPDDSTLDGPVEVDED